MKSGRKVGNTIRSIRSEDLFFSEITLILGEKSERRDQSSFSCLVNINFWKSLPRAPEFEYPPLMITVKWRQRRSELLNINLYQVNYKNILDFNCWLTIISKMLTKFIAFLVTNRLHTMNLTGHKLTTLKKTLATIFKVSACKISFI